MGLFKSNKDYKPIFVGGNNICILQHDNCLIIERESLENLIKALELMK